MRILITGGAGAIGGNLVSALTEDAEIEHLTVLDDLSSGYLENLPESGRVTFVRGSVTDDELLHKIFESGKFHSVFHFAANFANQSSVEFPRRDLEVNGMGTLKVLEYSHRAGVRRFVYSSSSCVYGQKDGVLSEDNKELAPETPYADTKLLGERYVSFFNSYHGLDTVTLRFFNSYGPGEYPGRYRNVIPKFMQAAMQKRPLPITGDGSETRDFNYVSDTVAGAVAALKVPGVGGGVFNIGSGLETSILQLAETINQITGNPAGIAFLPRRKWDHVRNRRASILEARKHLHYEPSVAVDEGLKRTYAWFLEKDFRGVREVVFQ